MYLPTRENGRASSAGHVMASIDRRPEGEYLIIADISRDGRWLAVPVDEGFVLPDHR